MNPLDQITVTLTLDQLNSTVAALTTVAAQLPEGRRGPYEALSDHFLAAYSSTAQTAVGELEKRLDTIVSDLKAEIHTELGR